jgi:hypothetical protein
MPSFLPPREKKNVQTRAGIATGTATGAAPSDATVTATAASTERGSSTTAAAAPSKAIPEVNEVGCTVIYEGEGPLRAEYVDIYLTIGLKQSLTLDGLKSIVFVHGLDGHPVKTWSAKDVYWPKDLLGPGVQNVRILTFGYDATAAKAFERVNQNNLHDHAQALVSDLRGQRKKKEEVASSRLSFSSLPEGEGFLTIG